MNQDQEEVQKKKMTWTVLLLVTLAVIGLLVVLWYFLFKEDSVGKRLYDSLTSTDIVKEVNKLFTGVSDKMSVSSPVQ